MKANLEPEERCGERIAAARNLFEKFHAVKKATTTPAVTFVGIEDEPTTSITTSAPTTAPAPAPIVKIVNAPASTATGEDNKIIDATVLTVEV